MSLINFPDVPNLPGVPNIRRSAVGLGVISGIISTLQQYDVFGVLDGIFGPQWSILDKNGNVAIQPDSFISMEYKREFKIANHPVELGSFASYNKVSTPYDFHVTMTCNGQGTLTREQFLTTLTNMVESTDTYTINTPDATYINGNLVNYNYRRTSVNGVQLLTVQALFQEVRVTAQRGLQSVANPDAKDPTNNGTVTTSTPTTAQSSQYTGAQ